MARCAAGRAVDVKLGIAKFNYTERRSPKKVPTDPGEYGAESRKLRIRARFRKELENTTILGLS